VYKLWSSSLCSLLQPPATSSLLGTNIILSTLFSTLSICVLSLAWETNFHIHTSSTWNYDFVYFIVQRGEGKTLMERKAFPAFNLILLPSWMWCCPHILEVCHIFRNLLVLSKLRMNLLYKLVLVRNYLSMFQNLTVWNQPVSVAERSKACTVYDRLNIEITGSNPTRGMDVCLHFSVLCCPVFR
jgi:hypothetical protein